MAPSRTPGRNKGQGHWDKIGIRGRKTGVTLQPGVRDEHGLESIDGIFSSPEKSPAKPYGLNQISTISEGESMDIGQSTGTMPDPAEVMNRARNGNILFPPRSRSPIKTNIGSSPRRSLGPLSSPSRVRNGETPSRAMSHQPDNSTLEISRIEVTPSIEGSDKKGRKSDLKRVKKPLLNGKGRKRVFDLSMNDESDEDERYSIVMNGDNETNGVGFDESALNDVPLLGGSDVENTVAKLEVVTEITPVTKKRAGRPPKVAPKAPDSHASIVGQKQGRGRPSKKAKNESQPDTIIDPQEESSTVAAPVKEAEEAVTVEKAEVAAPVEETEEAAPVETEEAAPGEEAEEAVPVEEVENAINGKRKGSKPLTQGNANTKMKPPPRPKAKPAAKPAAKLKPTAAENGRSKSRSIFTARSETPAGDNGAVLMKTGRTSIKPLAFWRNERVVFGDGNLKGNVLTLPGIKEVIRTEEIEVPQPRRSTYRRPRAKGDQDQEQGVEDEEERAIWEIDSGIVRAQVMQWDPLIGRYDEENTEETEVAYAAEAIEMRDISGAEFRFAKTLTLPFFGSGMVDLPPGGTKRVKNSRKMQMVFFVFYGRVTVDVGTPTTSFSIGKGGMWQVPRGNFYSIANLSETQPARIFFAQGCEVNPEAVFDESANA